MWSLTSAGSDLVDTFAETLCGGSKTKYRYKGHCLRMGKRFDAGTIKGSGRVVYQTTVHGPVIGYAKVHGKTVAISRKRASFGQDILWQLPFRDLTTGAVHDVASFRKTMATSPFTFNIPYADDKDIAMYSAASCRSAPSTSIRASPPSAPAPTSGRASSPAPSTRSRPTRRAACWSTGTTARRATGARPTTTGPTARSQRVTMLLDGLNSAWQARPRLGHERDERRRDRGSAQRGADAGARRVAEGRAGAERSRGAHAGAAGRWHTAGSSRLDVNLDGVMDAGPGPAIWDALYPKLYAAIFGKVKGLDGLRGDRFGFRLGDFTAGGFWYVDKTLRTANGEKLARVQPALLRHAEAVRADRLEGAGLRPRRPRRAARRRERRADLVRARAAVDQDPLHQPPERDPAGDLVAARPPARAGRLRLTPRPS